MGGKREKGKGITQAKAVSIIKTKTRALLKKLFLNKKMGFVSYRIKGEYRELWKISLPELLEEALRMTEGGKRIREELEVISMLPEKGLREARALAEEITKKTKKKAKKLVVEPQPYLYASIILALKELLREKKKRRGGSKK